MEIALFSPEWFSALVAIIIIDLVLAGDNAIVIALAARKVPAHLQRRTILLGTLGAILARVSLTLVVAWLLRIPGLMLIGGLLLLPIAYKLMLPDDEEGDDHTAGITSFWGAIRVIVFADLLMGLDNVLGVAGAAHGDFTLVVIGLLISIPIVIWGSTIILKFVERYPGIVYLGAAVLALTGAKMIVSDPLFDHHVSTEKEIDYTIYFFSLLLVLGVGYWRSKTILDARAAKKG